MELWEGRVALVTGASAGIGAVVAKRLVEHGMQVVGCAKNIAKIQENAEALKGQKGSLTPICCDVSKEDEILAMFKKIKKDLGGVDVCINNADLAHYTPLLSGSAEDWRHMLEVNVIGLCVCAREAFKSMKEREVDDGHIILLGRISKGFGMEQALTQLPVKILFDDSIGFDEMRRTIILPESLSAPMVVNNLPTHMYSVTKFAVRALTEGLKFELNELKSHIRVTAISPNLTETEFCNWFLEDEKAAQEWYSEFENLHADHIVSSIIYALSASPRDHVVDMAIQPTEQDV